MTGVDGHYRVRVFPDTYQVSVRPGLIPRRGVQPVELISPQEVQPVEVVVVVGEQAQQMEADLVVTPIELPEELQRAAAAYQALRGYRDTTIVEIHMVRPGMDNRMTIPVWFAFERPNRVRLESKATPMMGGTWFGAREAVSDGKMLFTYLGRLKQYKQKEAPEKLTSADLWGPGGPVRSMIVQKIMVEDDPFNELIKGVVEVKEVGNENLGGIPVTVLELTRRVGSLVPRGVDVNKPIKFRLWVGEKDFLIRQVAFELDMIQMAEMGMPEEWRARMEGMKIGFTERHTAIEVDPVFSEETFTFAPPDKAKLVEQWQHGH